MAPPVLQPQGVHYDLDRDARPRRAPRRLILALVLAAVAAGVILAWPRLRRALEREPSAAGKHAAPHVPVAAVPAPPAAPPGLPGPLPLPAVMDPDVRRLFGEAEVACRADDLVTARRRYLQLLAHPAVGAAAPFAERRLGEISVALVCTSRSMPEKREYVVRPGDSIDRIARQSGNTRELVARANNIRQPERLQAGKRLLVLDKPVFRVDVQARGGFLRLMLNAQLLKTFRLSAVAGGAGSRPLGACVATGRDGAPVWRRPPAAAPDGTTPAGLDGLFLRGTDAEDLGVLVPDGAAVRILR